jgi:hypothetical protein
LQPYTGVTQTPDLLLEKIGRKSLKVDGARGRNRTADTMIFSHVLYQLSYPGIAAAASS